MEDLSSSLSLSSGVGGGGGASFRARNVVGRW